MSKPDLNELFGNTVSYTAQDVADALEPVHGDKVVCTLTPDFRNQYVAMSIAEMQLSDTVDYYLTEIASRIGEQLVERISGMNLSEASQTLAGHTSMFSSEYEFVEYTKLLARHQRLYFEFWYNLRSDLDTWNSLLSVRMGYKVVDLGKKFVV